MNKADTARKLAETMTEPELINWLKKFGSITRAALQNNIDPYKFLTVLYGRFEVMTSKQLALKLGVCDIAWGSAKRQSEKITHVPFLCSAKVDKSCKYLETVTIGDERIGYRCTHPKIRVSAYNSSGILSGCCGIVEVDGMTFNLGEQKNEK